jgi:hypothetical protein
MSEATDEITQTESNASDPAQRKPGRFWILWAILAPLIYVLSVGPAAMLAVSVHNGETVCRVLYAPVRLVAEHCPPANSFLTWYLNLWVPEFP